MTTGLLPFGTGSTTGGSGAPALTTTSSISATFSGPWASNKTCTVNFTLTGNIVTMEITSILAAANATATTLITTSGAQYPAGFVPARANTYSVPITITNSGGTCMGTLSIAPGAGISIILETGQTYTDLQNAGWANNLYAVYSTV